MNFPRSFVAIQKMTAMNFFRESLFWYETLVWEKLCNENFICERGNLQFTSSSSRVNERFIIKLCNDIHFLPQIFSAHYFFWIILAQNYSCNVNSLHNPLGNSKRNVFHQIYLRRKWPCKVLEVERNVILFFVKLKIIGVKNLWQIKGCEVELWWSFRGFKVGFFDGKRCFKELKERKRWNNK